jgi:peptidoglycan L-alanyl-D-glutamate endopeptidase CwlK
MDAGYQITAGEFLRPQVLEDIYVKEGKSHTSHSLHPEKLAGDLFFFKDGLWIQEKHDLQHIGDYWEYMSPKNRWGGNFPTWYPKTTFIDVYHFERHI